MTQNTQKETQEIGGGQLEDAEEIEHIFGPAFLKLREHEHIRFYPDRIEMDLLRDIRAHGENMHWLTFRRVRDNSVLERMLSHNNQATQAFVAISEFAQVPLSTVRKELDPDDVTMAMEVASCFLTPGRRAGRR